MITSLDISDAHRLLGENIRLARQRRGMSQENLARRMRSTRGTVIRLESGDPGVRLQTLTGALQALGFDVLKLPTIADPLTDAIGLSEERRRVAPHKKPDADPRDDYDFGPRNR